MSVGPTKTVAMFGTGKCRTWLGRNNRRDANFNPTNINGKVRLVGYLLLAHAKRLG